MAKAYSVKQVNSYIKNMFDQDFMLKKIYVAGEVSNCKYHTSGHIYFSLKDESGTIACAMFAGKRSGLSFRLQDGQQVVVLGSISVYERSGSYQLYANSIILDGAGLLYEKFAALKKELAEMGMFDPSYKQAIPAYSQRIGVVTAPTGAAIQDIIQVAKRRNPYVQLLVYPAKVQGEGAAQSIIRGIEMMQKQQVDVIIVGRGGGSIEDLWAFNEEAVAKAIFHSQVPIISAVGHETDTTIADFVADRRAPTPSAAAEIAVYEDIAVRGYLDEAKGRLRKDILHILTKERSKWEKYHLKINHLHPEQKLRTQRQYAIDLENQLRQLMDAIIKQQQHRFALYLEKMNGLSPLKKMQQGYSYVENTNSENVRSVEQVRVGDKLTIYLSDGKIITQVCERERRTSS